MKSPVTTFLALGALLSTSAARAAITTAPGFASYSIPTPATVQGGVVRVGEAVIVGQGAFGAGLQSIVRLDGGGATTIATGFNSLGGFAIDSGGTLYVVDNGGNLAGAATGDTLFAIPDALTRTTAATAAGSELVPAGTISSAQDLLLPGDGSVLVADAAGPGAGRVVRVSGGSTTNLITGLDYVASITSDGSSLLVGNVDGSFAGNLLRFDLAGAPQPPLATGLSGNYAHVVEADGTVLVSGGFGSGFSSNIVAIPAGGGSPSERAYGFSFSSDLFYDAARDETLVLDVAVSEVTTICRDGDGDGVCDADDVCPDVADPAQTDTDGDGVGDACDDCSGPPVAGARLKIGNVKLPGGDESLQLQGSLGAVGGTVDPITTGAHVVVSTGAGGVVDAVIPSGAYDKVTKSGWKANGKLTAWKYKNPAGPLGKTQVQVKLDKKVAGVVHVQAKGSKGTYPVAAAPAPVRATVVLGAGQCGDAEFPAPACVLSAKGKGKLDCK